MEVVYLALGIALIALVLWDVFESIVVPRPTHSRVRISRYAIRSSWAAIRALGRHRDGTTRDGFLGLFAPAVTLMLLAVWLGVLVVGYGLVFLALHGDLRPDPHDLGATLYYAATSILTLGSNDTLAVGPAARAVVVFGAASGLGVVALVVTFLFSLYGSYQRREILVVSLQAAAGAPPSAVTLLETYARLELTDRLPGLFSEWERWAAEVLDTHVAYPLLGYFRSSHDNLSWISALGTVLDAASLVLTTVKGLPCGEAELLRRVGAHLAEDVSHLAGTDRVHRPGLDRAAFDAARVRLAAAGYRLAPAGRSWREFEAVRSDYAMHLNAMASYWATPSTSWLGVPVPMRSAVHREDHQPEN